MSSADKPLAASRAVSPLLCAAACLCLAAPAHAGQDTDTFTVSATVLASCAVSANDLDFGDYDPVEAAHLDAAGAISVTCTNGAGYEVGLSFGDGPGADASTRFMSMGAETLSYGLYRNAGRTLPWGQDGGVDTVAGTGSGVAQSIDLYGRVPMQQAVPAGDYEDTIVVTVTW